jgi:hypothetical protein
VIKAPNKNRGLRSELIVYDDAPLAIDKTIVNSNEIYTYLQNQDELVRVVKVCAGLYIVCDKDIYQRVISYIPIRDKYRLSIKQYSDNMYGIAFCDLNDIRADEKVWEGIYYTDAEKNKDH